MNQCDGLEVGKTYLTRVSSKCLPLSLPKVLVVGLILVLCGLTVRLAFGSDIHDYAPKMFMDVSPRWKLEEAPRFQRLPQAIVFGIRKCGTRALLEFLNLHPQIRTVADEVHFFDRDENYRQGLEWYRRQMSNATSQEIIIEKSPAYFISRKAPSRIFHMNSTIKLLLIVKDPVERLISDYTQVHLWDGPQPKNASRTIEELAINEKGEVNLNYKAVRTSMYCMYMPAWLKLFSRKQIHVVDGNSFVRNPLAELRAVESFLGLETWYSDESVVYNSSKGFYCLKNATHSRCLGPTKGRAHPIVDKSVIDKLYEFYIPCNQHFAEMIGMNLSWT